MPITFGVNTWTWHSPFNTEDARNLFPKVRRMGFDLVEIALEDVSLLDPTEIRALLQDCGLHVALCGAFGPSRDLTHEDSAVRQQSLDYIQESLQFGEKIGAELFVGPMYSSVGKARLMPQETRLIEFERAVQGLKQAGVMASDSGMTLGVEPLNRFETDLINIAAQVKRLIQAVGMRSVKIHLDTFHMNIEEESIFEAVVLAGDDLCHVHASESNRGTPGMGFVAWDQLALGLHKIDYSGAVVIETFTPEVKEIARAAAIWRPLAPSQDELASNGLEFLHDVLEPM